MKPVLLIDQHAYGLAEAVALYTEREIIPARNLDEAETAMREEDVGGIVLEPMAQYATEGSSEDIPLFLEGVRKNNIPVLVYSTEEQKNLKEWGLESGKHYDDYVSKANDSPERLKASLDTLVG